MDANGRLAVVGVVALLCGPLPVLARSAPPLRSAASFAILGGSAVTNSGPSRISGNVGVHPGNTVSGFTPAMFTVGTIFPAGAQVRADANAAAHALGSGPCDVTLPPASLGGRTLRAGVYCFSGPDVALAGALILDAAENRDAVWIFRVSGTLTASAASSVLVSQGGYDGNVLWQVGTSASIGAGATFAGNLFARENITLQTGAAVSGRLIARTGTVALNANVVSLCCAPIALTPAALPNDMVTVPYNQTLAASGGFEPYTFAVTSGALPPGLTLHPVTGVLSGTPAMAGRFAFTVTAIDANGCRGSRYYILGDGDGVGVGIPTLAEGALWALVLLLAFAAARRLG